MLENEMCTLGEGAGERAPDSVPSKRTPHLPVKEKAERLAARSYVPGEGIRPWAQDLVSTPYSLALWAWAHANHPKPSFLFCKRRVTITVLRP